MSVKTEKLVELQSNTANIRNICIMAHVDHGKTTLADSLIASNGLISQKLAGKLRYMDSREDEQKRGITMKSSAIALQHSKGDQNYLINLIDSPGHVDFSSEVSTAVRLCDGAVILVDVIEGLCPQTKAFLRQSWIEGLKPVLVLNKIDRLITERKLTPLDAYVHLQQTLERVNACVGELFATDILGKVSQKCTDSASQKSADTTELTPPTEQVYEWSSGLEDTDDSHVYFSPDQGNVAFACALDGWGFGISHFAKMYADRVGIRENVLLKTLWGDFYLNAKAKRIMKGAQARAKKPLFVQFILENIWAVYEAVVERRDKEMVVKIISSLKLEIPPRDMRHSDPRILLQIIFSKWLPLSKAILDMVCEKLPNPLEMSEERCENLMRVRMQRFNTLPNETQALKKHFLSCSSDPDVPVIIFISKMFTVEKNALPKFKQRPLTAEELAQRRKKAQERRLAASNAFQAGKGDTAGMEENNGINDKSNENESKEEILEESPINDVDSQVFIAFARVFSGTVRKGQRLYVLGPKHNPAEALENLSKGMFVDETLALKDLKSDQHITSCEISELYLLMGRELEMLNEVKAGNVIGIGNLDEHVLKSATLSTSLACPPFTDLHVHSPPIVRVALEPARTVDMPALIRGLKLLNQADSSVDVRIQETGEHVIITSGEVHLQRCLDDLKNSFAKIEIVSSQPIVPFRETIISPPTVDMVNELIEDKKQTVKANKTDKQFCSNQVNSKNDNLGIIILQTANKLCTIKFRAAPLPTEVTELLESHVDLLKAVDMARTRATNAAIDNEFLTQETISAISEFRHQLNSAFDEAGSEWKGAAEQIWTFGPRRQGANILLCRIVNCEHPSYWQTLENVVGGSSQDSLISKYECSITGGFQLATLAGPLCEEPMRGVCFSIEGWDVSSREDGVPEDPSSDPFGPFSGQIMSTVKEGCRRAFQMQPQRLMTAMYTCNILVTAEVLGKMYAVLGKRNGRVLSSDLLEGSQVFNITATLPVIESFDFANEIRKQTSGHAMPQLVFTHWEVVDIDPFWVPSTEEEYVHFGEKADSENRARRYVNSVRRRKGLSVDEKIVEHAEKQRTLTRNK